MKKNSTFFGLLLFASLVVVIFYGCEGPAGPPGDTTIANLEGFREGIVCGDCHNPDTDTTYYVWAKKYQWELSKHFYGGDFERNTSTCAGCHTTEGFIQVTQGKPVTDHVDASPPGCFACHSPHARGDFSLRTKEPVVLNATVEGEPDAIFDYGKGNLCASCHKPRTLSPMPDPSKTAQTDTIRITSNRWYPHYGVQSQMLSGNGGFEFLGYQYTGNSNHSTNETIMQEGCIACHMADATAGSGIAGGHTMNIAYEGPHGEEEYLLNGCTAEGCHGVSGFTIDYIGSSSFLTGGLGTHTATEAYLDTLFGLLLNRNWITQEGLINASQNNPLKIAPAYKAGALFNYFFVEHDLSKGSHNTRYTLELLISSIAELRNF